MQNNLVDTFKEELNLTDSRLEELAELKKGLVIDVKTDAGFKLARKERSEQNKILGRIDRAAIDGKKSMDEARQSLKDAVSDIYSPIVTAFEAENALRKEAERQKKEAEEARINGIRSEINGIRQFSKGAHGKASSELQEIIEAVDLIDISANFAELTQEAMQAKDKALGELNAALVVAIQQEQLTADREKLRLEQEEQAEKDRKAKAGRKAQELLNQLAMVPVDMLGSSAAKIADKISSLTDYMITDECFGDLQQEAAACKDKVLLSLGVMLNQQEIVEAAQAKTDEEQKATEGAARIKAEEEKAETEQAEKDLTTQAEDASAIDDTNGAGYGGDFVEATAVRCDHPGIDMPGVSISQLNSDSVIAGFPREISKIVSGVELQALNRFFSKEEISGLCSGFGSKRNLELVLRRVAIKGQK